MFPTSPNGEGIDLSSAFKVWITIALSECRIDLITKLIRVKIGLKEVEDYSENLNLKLRSKIFKSKDEQSGVKIVTEVMTIKLRDEKCYYSEMVKERNMYRREIMRLFGENTRRQRLVVKKLRTEAQRHKTLQKKKYEKKLQFLENKYSRTIEEKLDEIPTEMEKYRDAKIFSGDKFDEIETDKIEITILGNLKDKISEAEYQVLQLHTKFAIMPNLEESDYEMDLELGFAKLRYQLLKELGEKLSEEEENMLEGEMNEKVREKLKTQLKPGMSDKSRKELIEKLKEEMSEEMEEMVEEEEAKTRQVFNPLEKIFDNRKKRVTDLKENSRVILPKPLPPVHEANIEMRRNIYKKLFKDFKETNCNRKGEQKPNMTENEIAGLRTRRKRISEGEIVVLKTDKSGKFCITDRETYLELGKVHTSGDREINRGEIKEREKILNAHTSMWIKMTNMGEDHKHEGRTRESKISRSNNLANMRLLIKDHKEKLASRPVVSGCDSNTLGMSNMVSELLESVCNSITDPYEVISSEDMLAKVAECNKALEKVREVRDKAGESLPVEEEEIIMFGSDVVALFPSMTEKRTGKIVREQAEKSDLKCDGFDWSQVALYISINREKTGDLAKIERLLPWRKSTRGTAPGMKNLEITRKEKNTTTTWIFPSRTPTEAEKRIMLGRMAEIGVRIIFSNFCYTFGGKNYIQMAGGPIGARVTMAAARLVMQNWSEQYRQILEKASLDIKLFTGYVDDNRQATSTLRQGMRFNENERAFIHSETSEKEDMENGFSTTVRMSLECQ